MTSVNVTTTKNTVTVNGETRVVTVKTAGPQGPAFSDGDKGDVTVSSNGTAISINNSAITSAKIADGAIVNADINASAAIALSKLATGALPTAITVTSANISDLSIVDADISGSAAISLSKLATGALPTAITVTSANISDLSIVNADINASAAIQGTKISPNFGSQNIVTTGTGATGALGVTGDITVSGTVDGRDVATDGTKLDGIETGATADQTASEIKTAYESNSDTNAFTDADHSKLDGIESGATADQTKSDIDALGIAASTAATLATSRNIGGVSFNGSANIDLPGVNTAGNQNTSGNAATATTLQTARTIAGTSFDGSANIDISYTNLTNKLSVGDGGLTQNNFTNALKTKLDGIETAATADQTAAEIKTLLDSNGIVNSNVDASAAIAGTKISPNFGSQNVVTTGTFGSGDITILDASPSLRFTENDANPDYKLIVNNGVFKIVDETNSNAERFVVNTDGHIDVTGNLDIGAGVDVTGNITVTGTVDGVDIATRDTLFGGLTSSSGVLTNGVTATTQSASDNSTKVATTAYTDTAISNLVNSAPSTLDTLKELSDALGSDPNFATTVTNSIATKLPLAGGTLTGNLTISNASPIINFTDTNNNPDFRIQVEAGNFLIEDATNSYADRFVINSSGNIGINNNNPQTSLDVTGDITVSGTVDGRDLANDGTKLDGIESNATADQTASEIVALVADQAIAPSEIDMEDNEKIKIGTGDDLQIYHNGANSFIDNVGVGDLNVRSNVTRFRATNNEQYIAAIANGAVELYYDNVKRLETTSTGVTVTSNVRIPDGGKYFLGTGDDMYLNHSGSHGAIANTSGNLYISTHSGIFLSTSLNESAISANSNGSVELYYDNAKKFETTSAGNKSTGTFEFVHSTGAARAKITSDGNYKNEDNVKFISGTGNDLQIFHDGSNSKIVEGGTGSLIIQTSNFNLDNAGGTENILTATENGAVELYHDNSKKFETTSSGVKFTGTLEAIDNQSILLGTSNDFRIRHTGSHSEITDEGTGNLRLGSNQTEIRSADLGEIQAKFIDDGAVELYYDNNKTAFTSLDAWNVYGRSANSGMVEIASNQGANNNDRFRIHKTSASSTLSIQNYTSGSWENNLKAIGNGAVELYFDNSKKLETTSTGVNITGVTVDDGATHDGDVLFQSNSGNIFFDKSDNALEFSDNNKAKFGGSGDLEIYHDGSNSRIVDAGTGELRLDSNSLRIRNAAGTETSAVFVQDGACELRFNNVKKFETTSAGATVTGGLTTTGNIDAGTANFLTDDNGKFISGTAGDLQIYHDGTFNYIVAPNNHEVHINANSGGSTENMAKFKPNGAVELYFNGSKKAFTYADGLHIDTGVLRGDDNALIKLGNSGDLEIYHDSSTNDSFIKELGTGRLQIHTSSLHLKNQAGDEINLVTNENGNCELWFDNSKKLETTSYGVLSTESLKVEGDYVLLDNSADSSYRLSKNGTALFSIRNNTVNGVHLNTQNSALLCFGVSTGSGSGTVESTLSINSSGNVGIDNQLASEKLHLADNKKLAFGNGADLKIFHDGSNSYITNITGTIHIQGKSGENSIRTIPDGAVELYYDHSKKFETSSTGATVTGFLGINVASPDSPLEVAGTGPSLATIHHSDGGTNDEARIMLGALSSNPPDQRGAGISARNNGAGHNLEIQTSSSHSAGPSTKMIVTSAGLVGIGTTSLIGNSSSVYLTVNGSSLGGIALKSGDSTQGYLQGSGGTVTLSSDGSKNIRFDTNGSQRMNIASDGNVGIGKTSSSIDVDGAIFTTSGQNLLISKSGSGGKIITLNRRTNVGLSIEFFRGSSVGSISHNNTSTAYNTSSDYRLKENVVALSDGITRLKTLKPYRFNFIADKDVTVDGFLAHEVTAVPEAITGTKDAVITQEMVDNEEYEKERLGEILPQGIDQSKLVPLLVAAVQEAIGKIEVLETEVAALKAG